MRAVCRGREVPWDHISTRLLTMLWRRHIRLLRVCLCFIGIRHHCERPTALWTRPVAYKTRFQ